MCCKVRRQCSSGVAEEMLCTVALSNSSVWFESNPSRDVPPPGVLQAPRTAPEPAPVGGKDGKDGKGGKSGGTAKAKSGGAPSGGKELILETPLDGNNNHQGVIFDVAALEANIELHRLSIHPADKKQITVEVWWREGTGIGNERSEEGWECLGSCEVDSKGQGTLTEVPLEFCVTVAAGTTVGIFIWITGSNQRYTNADGQAHTACDPPPSSSHSPLFLFRISRKGRCLSRTSI